MPDFQPFVMERMMSKFEQGVDFNLSESGVHPMLLKDLLEGDAGRISFGLPHDYLTAALDRIADLIGELK